MTTAHRSDIDGLRAVAVVSVVAFHAFPDAVPGGFIGVDIFFVISGFLISGIILGGLDRESFSFRAFYSRRIRRIFPALIVVLACCLVLGWFLLFAVEYEALGKHTLAGAGFASNLVLWDEVGYFDVASAAKPLLHLWSLGIEEQFYLAWPLILWLTWRVRGAPRLVTAIVLLGSFGLGVMQLAAHPAAAFYAPQDRLWELMVGAVLAQTSRKGGRALSILGAVAIVLGLVLTRERDFPGWWALLPTLGAAALIAAGPDAPINRRVLGNPVMGWIGAISYPLYLWHWPILSFLGIMEGRPLPLWARLGGVALSVVLAALTQRFVERPLRFGGSGRLKTLALCGAMVLVGSAGFYVYQHAGLPARALQQGVPAFTEFGYQVSPDCLVARPYITGGGLCYESPDRHPETILLIGDSHAEALAPAFIELSERDALGANLVVVSKAGCFPFAHTETFDHAWTVNAACQKFGDGAVNEAIADRRITTVVLVGRYSARVLNATFGDEEWLPGNYRYDDGSVRSDRPEQVFELGLVATLRRLVARGIRVVFLDQTPELGFHPNQCVRRPRLSGGVRCGLPLATVMARQRVYREIATRVLRDFPSVVRVDPTPLFCDDEQCSPWQHGEMMYHDDDHLAPLGARAVATEILSRLGR